MTPRHPLLACIALVALAMAAAATSARAFPVMTFEGYPNATPILTQFQPQGVRFSSFGSPCTIFLDAAEATSGVNILCGASNFRDIDITMVDPVTGLASPSWLACHASLNVISAGWSVVQVTSKNAAGATLQSFTVTHPSGPVNGLGNVDHLEFTTPGIAKISMNFTSINFGDGIGIDDVIVDFDCTTPVAPSTWGAVKSLYR